jgi:hypothetical protein
MRALEMSLIGAVCLAGGCSLMVGFDDLTFDEAATTSTGGSGGTFPESCNDGVEGPDETDLDCGGVCAPCGVGKKCLAPGDCTAGFCADGICCDRACDGPCEACASGGECLPHDAGTDPEDDCIDHPAGFTSCSGVSACWGTHVESLGVGTATSSNDKAFPNDFSFRDVAIHPSGDAVGVGAIDTGAPLSAVQVMVTRIGAVPWAQTFGGAENDFGRAVAILPGGDVIVAGSFSNAFTLTCSSGGTVTSEGATDIFVARLHGSDGACVWVRGYGGVDNEDVRAVAVDGVAIYLAGVHSGPSALDDVSLAYGGDGNADAFVARLAAEDGAAVWATTLNGAAGHKEITALAVRDGVVAATGWTSGGGDTTFAASSATCASQLPVGLFALTALLDISGGSPAWCPAWGPTVAGAGVAIGADASIYVVGLFAGTANFGVGPELVSKGFEDGFLAKLTEQGDTDTVLAIGSAGWDAALAVALDGSGQIVVGGHIGSAADLGGGMLPFARHGGAGATSGDLAPFILGLSPTFEHRFSFSFAAETINTAYSLDALGDRFVVGGAYTGPFDLGGAVLDGAAPVNGFLAIFEP